MPKSKEDREYRRNLWIYLPKKWQPVCKDLSKQPVSGHPGSQKLALKLPAADQIPLANNLRLRAAGIRPEGGKRPSKTPGAPVGIKRNPWSAS